MREELISSRDHVFDGKILNRDKPDYQLCDIEDSLIKRYIYDERLIHDHCDVRPSFLLFSSHFLHPSSLFSSKLNLHLEAGVHWILWMGYPLLGEIRQCRPSSHRLSITLSLHRSTTPSLQNPVKCGRTDIRPDQDGTNRQHTTLLEK